jgi:hypothetical protein
MSLAFTVYCHIKHTKRSPLTVRRSPKKTFFALSTDNGGQITENTITIDCSPKKRFSGSYGQR